MKCIQCGCETETGCSRDDCPHAGMYAGVLEQQKEAVKASPKEDSGKGEVEGKK